MMETSIFSFAIHNVFPLPKTNFNLSVTCILSSANAFNLGQAKILSFCKGLNSIVWVSSTVCNDRAAERVEQHQTTRICRLVSLYTHRKIHLWSGKPWRIGAKELRRAVTCHCEYRCHNGSFSLSLDPFPKRQILDVSKLTKFADDNFKFDENGRKFFKRVEKKKKKTVGKGEIARNEQFLLFPQCFQKTCTADT